MRDMTVGNLRSAFGGESMAHMRYKVWADRAEAEGFPNVSRLFKAVSAAEQAHASGHFNVMSKVGGGSPVTAMAGFGVGSTAQNLAGAIEGELFEVNEMYPAFIQVAQAQGETQALRSFNWAMAAEKIHATMYQKAQESVQTGKDVQMGLINVCMVCGHTVEGDAPDKCPVCNALKKKYVSF